ncbi:YkgJ family cysteine cluster protein [Rubricoccus marinus]|uniref:Zinc/iron-chelating domain-containing protein n=1 Tax=Rubricoccus marinus TaxID=716817 RepID=A0A259U1X5_9BACT|nr:YkgJ family cysteine cluster protein [Rubricoccus marinus]OZC03847.1 hypothetical protein BSZ36_13135 [Rubricoccus marinus]
MYRLPVVPKTRRDSFSYRCNGCGRCCHGKQISVGPYEVARLAEALGVSTSEALATSVDPETSTLRWTDGGVCVHYDAGRCAVHAGRPLACRLYPLGWITMPGGAEMFIPVEPHPESAGVYGEAGDVEGYLQAQGVPPYARRSVQYEAVALRAAGALDDDGADPGAPPPVSDVDAAVRTDCDARDVPVPESVEDRVDLHLALLHRWLDAAGAPPATS